MLMTHWNDDCIAGLDVLFITVEDKQAVTFHKRPCLYAMKMTLVRDALAWIQSNALSQGVMSVRIGGFIKDTICSPSALFIHRPWCKVVHGILDVLGVALLAHDDAVRRCCDNDVFKSIRIYGMMKFIDYMGVLTV